MKTKRERCLPVALAAVAMLAAYTTPSLAHNSAGAAIAAGIIGLAMGAAVADSTHPRDTVIYGGPPPASYGPPPPFSPAAGVVCYPARQQCYMPNGRLNWTWTDRIFKQY